MKFFKRFLTIILIVLFLVVLGLWSPWNKWNLNLLNLLGIQSQQQYATLKVKSLQGAIDVYVDGKLEDTATDNIDFAEIDPISPGDHTIDLKKEGTGNYYEYTRKITFEAGLDVVIAYELGPTQTFSEGHLLYARKNYLNIDNPRLTVFSIPDGVTVYMDDKLIGTAPIKELELDNTQQHKMRFEKKGYDTMEMSLLPDNQADRDKLKGYDLQLEVNLFAQPLPINNITN